MMPNSPEPTPDARANGEDATKASEPTIEQLKEGIPDADAR
jgi:hypothetical protein